MNTKMQSLIKKINQTTILLIVISCLTVFFTPRPQASVGSAAAAGIGYTIVNKLAAAGSAIIDVAENKWATDELEDIFKGPSDTMNEAIKIVGDQDGVTGKTFADKNESIINLFKYIGFFIAIIIAMTRFITNVESGKDPMECVFKILVEIGIVGVFMINLSEIVDKLGQLGFYLYQEVSGSNGMLAQSTFNKADLEAILDGISGNRTGKYAWSNQVHQYLAPFSILNYGINVIVYMAVFQVVLETGLRRLFVPLAIADIYGEGWRSSGARYLKKYFGCFLKLIVMIATISVASTTVEKMMIDNFAKSLNDDSFGAIAVMVLGVYAAEAMMMLKAGELANDVVGA